MTDSKKRTFRSLYQALGVMTDFETTALAKAHACRPAGFLSRWRNSEKLIVDRSVEPSEPFHPRSSESLVVAQPADRIPATKAFAAHVAAGGDWLVDGDAEIGFRYVDREIFFARTLDKISRVAPRSTDLLLVDTRDGTPIIAELKRRRDALPYYALVQSLLHAVELSSPEQRERLRLWYPHAGFANPEVGPFVDVHLVFYEPPSNWTAYEPSVAATSTIAAALLALREAAAVLRRVALLEAHAAGNRLAFTTRWVHSSC